MAGISPRWKSADAATAPQRTHWTRRMSDHIAYALLIYTTLQIFVTVHALKGEGGSILPYFALVFLVGMVIPACRSLERRWERLEDSQIADEALAAPFRRDAILVWVAAIGMPFLFTAIITGLSALG